MYIHRNIKVNIDESLIKSPSTPQKIDFVLHTHIKFFLKNDITLLAINKWNNCTKLVYQSLCSLLDVTRQNKIEAWFTSGVRFNDKN